MTNQKISDAAPTASYIELASTIDAVLIDSVIAGENKVAKLYLSANPALTVEQVLAFAADADADVRLWVVWRKSLPKSVLADLCVDGDERVRKQALKHFMSVGERFLEYGQLVGVSIHRKRAAKSVHAVGDVGVFKYMWNLRASSQVALLATLDEAMHKSPMMIDPKVLAFVYDAVLYRNISRAARKAYYKVGMTDLPERYWLLGK